MQACGGRTEAATQGCEGGQHRRGRGREGKGGRGRNLLLHALQILRAQTAHLLLSQAEDLGVEHGDGGRQSERGEGVGRRGKAGGREDHGSSMARDRRKTSEQTSEALNKTRHDAAHSPSTVLACSVSLSRFLSPCPLTYGPDALLLPLCHFFIVPLLLQYFFPFLFFLFLLSSSFSSAGRNL